MFTSQGSSQGGGADRLCLPLSKFSHATSAIDGRITWTHLASKDDLFVVFDTLNSHNSTGAAEKSHRFKVLQDPNVLEDHDIALLASEAQKAASEIQGIKDPPRNPSVAVVMRAPCIAVKYPIHYRLVRRFQIRFAKQEHFYEALSILTRFSVPVQEAGQPPKQPMQALPYSIATGVQQSHNIVPQLEMQPPPSFVGQNTSQFYGDTATSHHMASNYVAPQVTTSADNRPPHQQHLIESPIFDSNDHAQSRMFHPHATETATYTTGRLGAPLDLSTYLGVSSQPQPIRASIIDIYTPRPSTAPIPNLTKIQNSMPPKRELPFARKEMRSAQVSNKTDHISTDQQVNDVSTAETSTLKNTGSTEMETQLEDDVEKTPKAKPRTRTAPKVKKDPVPRKTRSTAIRRKPLPRKAKDQTPIPSVKELLDQSIVTTNTLDTQALYERVQAKYSAGSIGIADTSQRPSENSNSCDASHATATYDPDGLTVSCRTLPPPTVTASTTGFKGSNTQQDLPQDPADKLTQDLASSAHSSGTQVENQNFTTGGGDNQDQDQDKTPTQASVNQSFNTTTSPTTKKTKQATTPRTTSAPTVYTQTPPQTNTLLDELLSNPNFTQAASKLSDFDTLSPTQKQQVLENFICENLDDDNFVGLCKALEGVWARTLCLKR